MFKTISFNFFLIFALGINNGFSQCSADSTSIKHGFNIRRIEFNYIIPDSMAVQIQNKWTWAACVQLFYKSNGLTFDQIFVVKRITGSPYFNQPETDIETLRAISGLENDVKDRISFVQSRVDSASMSKTPADLTKIMEDSNNKFNESCEQPYLVNIYYYKKDEIKGDEIVVTQDKIIIREIWTQSPAKREFSWIDSKSKFSCLIKVWIL